MNTYKIMRKKEKKKQQEIKLEGNGGLEESCIHNKYFDSRIAVGVFFAQECHDLIYIKKITLF